MKQCLEQSSSANRRAVRDLLVIFAIALGAAIGASLTGVSENLVRPLVGALPFHGGAFAFLVVLIVGAAIFSARRWRTLYLEGAVQATIVDIAESRDWQKLLDGIVRRGMRSVGCPSGGIYLCDPVKREVWAAVYVKTGRNYVGAAVSDASG